MKRLWAGLVIALGAAAAPAADPVKPVVEVRLKSAVDLVPVFEYLGETFGQGEVAKQVAGVVKQLADAEGGYEGLDLKRPVGGYVLASAKPEDGAYVLLVPVADEKAVLAALTDKLGLDPKKGKGGEYTVEVPNAPGTVYFRFAHKYLYVTMYGTTGVEEANLVAPAALFPKAGTDALATAVVHLDRVPADIGKTIYGQFEMQLADRAKGSASTGAQKVLEGLVSDVAVDALKTLVTDGKELTLTLGVDPKSDEIALALAVTPKAGTTLEKTLASFADRESVAAGVAAVKAPVLALGVNVPLPPDTKKKFAAVADEFVKAQLETAPKEQKGIMQMVADAVLPTIKSGDVQLGVALTPAKDGKVTLAAAVKSVEGEEIARTVKFVGGFIPADQVKFEAAVAKVGDRQIHKFTPAGKDGFGPFATSEFHVLTSNDLTAFSLDPAADGLKALAGAKGAKAPMLSAEVSVARFAVLTRGGGNGDDDKVKEFFGGDPAGKDTVKLTGTGGKSLDLKLTVKGKALALLAMSGAAAK